jgi:hypothetical protein
MYFGISLLWLSCPLCRSCQTADICDSVPLRKTNFYTLRIVWRLHDFGISPRLPLPPISLPRTPHTPLLKIHHRLHRLAYSLPAPLILEYTLLTRIRPAPSATTFLPSPCPKRQHFDLPCRAAPTPRAPGMSVAVRVGMRGVGEKRGAGE